MNFKNLTLGLFAILNSISYCKANKTISVNCTDLTNIEYETRYLVPRNTTFAVEIQHNVTAKAYITSKKKKIIYNVSTIPKAVQSFNNTNLSVITSKQFTMTNDAYEFNIRIAEKVTGKKDSTIAEITFIVYAKNYLTVMPTGGLAFMSFMDQYDYYYKAEKRGDIFFNDSQYNYTLQKEKVGVNANIYLGADYNYIFSDRFNAGLKFAFGFNFSSQSTPISAILGGNMSFGRKIKFNIGGGAGLMQFKTVPSYYFEQKIKTKFSSPPALPIGVNKWAIGWYFNVGVTIAVLGD